MEYPHSRDLTLRFLFRPLSTRVGPHLALLAGFTVSGLVHELVISLPAGGGYGGPTLFFGIQAGAILVERSDRGRMLGLGRGWRGWFLVVVVLLLPAPLLFHGPFVGEVMLPFFQFLGAIRCPTICTI